MNKERKDPNRRRSDKFPRVSKGPDWKTRQKGRYQEDGDQVSHRVQGRPGHGVLD